MEGLLDPWSWNAGGLCLPHLVVVTAEGADMLGNQHQGDAEKQSMVKGNKMVEDYKIKHR